MRSSLDRGEEEGAHVRHSPERRGRREESMLEAV